MSTATRAGSPTRKQHRLLALIAQRGHVTSLTELADAANLATGTTALLEIKNLINLGYVAHHPDGGYQLAQGADLLPASEPPAWCNSTVPYEVLVVLCRACDVNGWRKGARCTHRGLDLAYADQAWRRLVQIATQPVGGAS